MKTIMLTMMMVGDNDIDKTMILTMTTILMKTMILKTMIKRTPTMLLMTSY